MSRWVAFLGLSYGVVLGAATPADKLEAPFDKLAEKISGSVPVLFSSNGVCAGVLVADDLVLTAWHCVANLRRVRISWGSRARVTDGGVVVAADKHRDLAVVKLDQRALGREVIPISESTEPLASGEPVMVIGHPWGKRHQIAVGKTVEPDGNFFFINVAVRPGNSGGPVINAEGKVVGNVSRLNMFIGDRELADAASHLAIQQVMKEAAEGEPLSIVHAEGSFGVDFELTFDPLQQAMAGSNVTGYTYGAYYDNWDRVRLGFKHTVFRRERILALDTGYKFNFYGIHVVPYVGYGWYSVDSLTQHEGLRGGVQVRFWFLYFTTYWTWADGERRRAWAIGM